MIPIH